MERRDFLRAGAVAVLTVLSGKVPPAPESYTVRFGRYAKIGSPIILSANVRIYGNTFKHDPSQRGIEWES